MESEKGNIMLEYDKELAQSICTRLNTLLEDPGVREALQLLIETRVPVSEAVADHPTIQCQGESPTECSVGILGMLNGIIGGTPGHLIANFDDNSLELLHFEVRS